MRRAAFLLILFFSSGVRAERKNTPPVQSSYRSPANPVTGLARRLRTGAGDVTRPFVMRTRAYVEGQRHVTSVATLRSRHENGRGGSALRVRTSAQVRRLADGSVAMEVGFRELLRRGAPRALSYQALTPQMRHALQAELVRRYVQRHPEVPALVVTRSASSASSARGMEATVLTFGHDRSAPRDRRLAPRRRLIPLRGRVEVVSDGATRVRLDDLTSSATQATRDRALRALSAAAGSDTHRRRDGLTSRERPLEAAPGRSLMVPRVVDAGRVIDHRARFPDPNLLAAEFRTLETPVSGSVFRFEQLHLTRAISDRFAKVRVFFRAQDGAPLAHSTLDARTRRMLLRNLAAELRDQRAREAEPGGRGDGQRDGTVVVTYRRGERDAEVAISFWSDLALAPTESEREMATVTVDARILQRDEGSAQVTLGNRHDAIPQLIRRNAMRQLAQHARSLFEVEEVHVISGLEVHSSRPGRDLTLL